LERELGVTSVVCDRALLAVGGKVDKPSVVKPVVAPRADERDSRPRPVPAKNPQPIAAPVAAPEVKPVAAPEVVQSKACEFVFLHHCPLNSVENEILVKSRAALGRSEEKTPLVYELPLPVTKVYVVLGGLALKKFFPSLIAGPGEVKQGPKGERVAVTYSPVFFRRFSGADLNAKKREFWSTLKSAAQRARALGA